MTKKILTERNKRNTSDRSCLRSAAGTSLIGANPASCPNQVHRPEFPQLSIVHLYPTRHLIKCLDGSQWTPCTNSSSTE